MRKLRASGARFLHSSIQQARTWGLLPWGRAPQLLRPDVCEDGDEHTFKARGETLFH